MIKLKPTIYLLSRISTYIFILYVITDLKKGGDFKHVVPYMAFGFSLFYLILKRDFEVFKSHLFYALSGYVLISYLLIPFSFHRQISFSAVNVEILSGLFLFIAMHLHTQSEKRAESMVIFLIVLLVFVVWGGYFTYFSKYFSNNIINSGHMYPDITFRLLWVKMHYNGFAMTINLILSFAIAFLLLKRHQRYYKYLCTFIILFSSIAVLLSLSRGGWISFSTTLFLWGIFLGKNTKKPFILLAALIASMIILFSVLWFTVPSFKARIFSADIKTFTGRTVIWKNNIKAIQESPVVGWGYYGEKINWDKLDNVINRFQEKTIPMEWVHSHNIVLQVLFQQGIIGLLFFLYFMLISFLSILQAILFSYMNKDKRLLYYAIFVVFISVFIVHGLIEVIPFRQICLIIGFLSGLNWYETIKENSSGSQLSET